MTHSADFTYVAHAYGLTARDLRNYLRYRFGDRGYRVVENTEGMGLDVQVRASCSYAPYWPEYDPGIGLYVTRRYRYSGDYGFKPYASLDSVAMEYVEHIAIDPELRTAINEYVS